MKIKCSLCASCSKGFCSNTAKRKKGLPIKITVNKRRNCSHFELNEKEAKRLLSMPKPETFMRPEGYWMDRGRRRKLKKEYEKEIENTYLSRFSSTAAKEAAIKTTGTDEVKDDEKLF